MILRIMAMAGTVTDRNTGLMWQQSGTDKSMSDHEKDDYVRRLNSESLGGYNDWRLPTLEELASLLERVLISLDILFKVNYPKLTINI
ncbi:DUF1566 domain-containing protein [Desulfococcaceae bacterium HSG9]|nr:DUF1566 domain-containing protein [Desulfococcaceae bacterium HSG9]